MTGAPTTAQRKFGEQYFTPRANDPDEYALQSIISESPAETLRTELAQWRRE
jgi:hypothetical protein